MFKKLKKKLEEGEEGGVDFVPRRLPGSVIRSSSGDAVSSAAGTESDFATGTAEVGGEHSISREGFDGEWHSTENITAVIAKVEMETLCMCSYSKYFHHSLQTTSRNI